MIKKVAALKIAARGRPPVTNTLIGVCCVIFLMGPTSGLNPVYGTGAAQLAAQTAHFERWGVIPSELFARRPAAFLSPLTALFVHGNWFHLLGNMLFLYVFGGMAEKRMGRVRFTVFYLGVGYTALLAYAVAHAGSSQTLVGASGAISGVLGAFLYLFPKARVTSLYPFLFFLPLRFPAWMVLLFWFALQWVAARASDDRPGVAYLAHVVGFCLGFLYAWARFRGASEGRARVSGGYSARLRRGRPHPGENSGGAGRATEGDSQS